MSYTYQIFTDPAVISPGPSQFSYTTDPAVISPGPSQFSYTDLSGMQVCCPTMAVCSPVWSFYLCICVCGHCVYMHYLLAISACAEYYIIYILITQNGRHY